MDKELSGRVPSEPGSREPSPDGLGPSSRVIVTVSGFTGSGKSAVYGEIVLALRALGLRVEHSDHAAWQSECNTTHADWAVALELYRPTVAMVEENIPRTPEHARRWWQFWRAG